MTEPGVGPIWTDFGGVLTLPIGVPAAGCEGTTT
jgi:hypothetical protein